MIDLKDLRENPEKYRRGSAAKAYDPDIVVALLDTDAWLRKVQREREEITAEKNRIGKESGPLVGQFNKLGQKEAQLKEKLSDARRANVPADLIGIIQAELTPVTQELNRLLKEIEKPKLKLEQLKAREQELLKQEGELTPQRDELWLQVPLPPDPDVPEGESADDNIEKQRWNPDWFNPEKSFEVNKGFKPKDHITLMRALGMVDFERGVKISGSRSYVLQAAGFQLHNAILRFAFDFMTRENGFTPVSASCLVREPIMVGTGFFPHGRDTAYHISNPTSEEELYLTGTGEVGLMGLHMDEILDADQLPLCYTTLSTCFRREAGAAGKDTAGLFRVHQFDKVEQVVICRADEQESRSWHQKMIGFVETLLQRLELPYRLLQCCTADLGPKNADMIDLECWMPSRNAYGETHSASRLYDYQCRRLNTRYKDSDTKKNLFAHSLNNTVAASPRLLIPIVEMYQNEDGSITIPEMLRPYMNGMKQIG